MHYSSSEETKNKLITTAGRLFAENGIKAVTTRHIAKEAGENIGSIHYHFGSKSGLIEAALDFSAEPWKENPVEIFIGENIGLFESKEGQVKLLRGIVDYIYETMFNSKRPQWCTTLIFQILQRDMPEARNIFDNTIMPHMKSLMGVYSRITGCADFAKAHAWQLAIMAPATLYAVNPVVARKLNNNNEVKEEIFLNYLKNLSFKTAIVGIGLI